MDTSGWTQSRLAVEIERLIPYAASASLDKTRRLVFARHLAAKLAALERAGGDAETLAEYEEAMVGVIAKLSEAFKPPVATKTIVDNTPPTPQPPRRSKAPRADSDDTSGLQHELERMASQLKASSLEMHDKLRGQTQIFDRLDQATVSNEASVVRERDALQARTSASNRAFFSSIGSLLLVGLTFAFTYVFMKVFPK